MTSEERLNRIEHITAGIAEQRARDREEYKTLWRDTQRQINELAVNVNRNTLAIADTNDLIHKVADQLRTLGEGTDARIAALTSTIGEHLRAGHPKQ
jgi:hypothetical protein